MRIVVTGATGLIGRPLVKRLLGAGHQVIAWTRDPDAALNVLPARCEVARWNPAGTVEPAALRGVDAIVHLAGESVAGRRWNAERKEAIRHSRVASSRAIVEALEHLPAAERPRALISASATGFYGDRGDEVLTEASGPGEGFLAEVCRAWEQEILRASALGVRTVAIRVGIVLAKEGGALQTMLPPFRLGLGGKLGSGKQWVSWIHLDDMVALFGFALERADVEGVLNGVSPQPVTNAQLAAAVGLAVHRPALIPVPAAALKLLIGEMGDVVLTSQRVNPHATRQAGFVFRWTSLVDALTDLCGDHAHELVLEQWVPRTPAEVFPFFSDARNLEKITPDFLGFEVVDVNPEPVRKGTVINYKLSLRGIPMRWQSIIEAWEPERCFVDRQVRGPYRTWHHTHEFEPAGEGTIVRDRVRYEVPLGALGELVAGGLVRRDVERIFDFRRAKIAELFGAPTQPRTAETEGTRQAVHG